MNLETEDHDLRARLAAMEQLLDEHERISLEQASRLEALVSELQDQKRLLEATLNNLTDGVTVTSPEGTLTRFNPAAARLLGLGRIEAPKDERSTVHELFRPDGHTPFPPNELPLARALLGETVDGEEIFVRHAQLPEGAYLMVSASPLLDEGGRSMGAVAVFHDLGERKRWESALEQQLVREREKSELLERMQMAIHELSTPILELWDDVLALPVIGIVDSKRSVDMTERLLEEIVRRQAQFVIIDITGVELVDTATADRFLKLVTAVEYLGARCMLTGVRGAVAQALGSLGVDLGTLITLRTLKHALHECLRLMDVAGSAPERPRSRRASLGKQTRSWP
jgi:rsbT co-antagonist protein RsbR